MIKINQGFLPSNKIYLLSFLLAAIIFTAGFVMLTGSEDSEADVGDTFEYGGVSYKITKESADGNEVSVGTGEFDSNYMPVTCVPNDFAGILTIPASVDHDGKTYSVTSITDNAFLGVEGLTEVIIPSSVVSIGSASFSSTGLTFVNVPSSVVSIGYSAFAGCNNLQSASILSANIISANLFMDCAKLSSVILSHAATSIGEQSFMNCTSLVSLSIPSSVSSLGLSAFENCKSLESVSLPSGVAEIGRRAFWGCSSLTSVSIPSSVSKIENNTFQNCSELVSLSIPSSVGVIGSNAFSGCTALSSVILPYGVTEINKNAFKGCSGLTEVAVPLSLTTVSNTAFSGASFFKEDGTTAINPQTDLADFKGHVYIGDKNCMKMASSDTHVLFIEYSGSPSALSAHAEILSKGGNYSVDSPTVEGYLPDRAKVEGTVGDADVYSEVFYAQSFTITWKNDDGSVIDTTEVRLGSMPAHADVVKVGDAQYTYTFSRWDPQLALVTGDSTYTAVFDSTVNKYDVIWKNGDDVIETDKVEYGAVPAYLGNAPVKASDTQYSYSFLGWDGDISAPIEGNKTFNAVFRATALLSSNDKDYHFYLYSSVSGSDQAINGWIVGQGTTVLAAFTDALADRGIGFVGFDAATNEVFFNQHKYFSDWIPGDWAHDGDLYNPNIAIWNYNEKDGWHMGNTFGRDSDTVYLISYERYVAALGPTAVSLGALITGTDPAPYGIVYDGSTGGYAGLYEAAMAYLPTAEQQYYTGLDGSGCGLSYNAASDTEGCGGFDIAFTMWAVEVTRDYSGVRAGYDAGGAQYGYMQMAPVDRAATPEYLVFGDMADAVGNYDGTPARYYTLKWVDGSGTVIETDSGVKHGAQPTFDGAAPVRASTAEFSYTFTGWSPELTAVTGDATYVAQFRASAVGYQTGENPSIDFGTDAGTITKTLTNKAKADAQAGTINSLSLTTSNGTISIDAVAIASLMVTEDTEISIVKATSLSAAAKAAVGDRPVYTVTIGEIHDFGSGRLTISLPYALADGESADGVYVCCVTADGALEKLTTAYSSDKVSFETDHLSDFAIMYEEKESSGSDIMLFVAAAVAIAMVAVIAFIIMKRREA